MVLVSYDTLMAAGLSAGLSTRECGHVARYGRRRETFRSDGSQSGFDAESHDLAGGAGVDATDDSPSTSDMRQSATRRCKT